MSIMTGVIPFPILHNPGYLSLPNMYVASPPFLFQYYCFSNSIPTCVDTVRQRFDLAKKNIPVHGIRFFFHLDAHQGRSSKCAILLLILVVITHHQIPFSCYVGDFDHWEGFSRIYYTRASHWGQIDLPKARHTGRSRHFSPPHRIDQTR